jgi:hypothetical protein
MTCEYFFEKSAQKIQENPSFQQRIQKKIPAARPGADAAYREYSGHTIFLFVSLTQLYITVLSKCLKISELGMC